jgi:hypothetical protein
MVDRSWLRRGLIGFDDLPYVLGRDVSGVVEACGTETKGHQKGDEIYAMLAFDRGAYAEHVSLSDLIAGNRPSRIFQSTGLMLAAFTFSRISFGPGVGIGNFRNFITSREPNLSIMTTSISAMKHSSGLLQFQKVREARSFFGTSRAERAVPEPSTFMGLARLRHHDANSREVK